MISLFQVIIAFVLLGLGALFYFIYRKSPGKPQSDDSDPFEDVEPESVEPAKTTPVVSDEPDIKVQPEVIINPTKPVPEDEPVQPTPNTTPAKHLIPVTEVTTPIKHSEPLEFRRGWPNGTKWNLKGSTGNNRQRCNDNCKSLGYNYFTHNPPPADGGCGCFRSNVELSQLIMTDHSNAKTRRVV